MRRRRGLTLLEVALVLGVIAFLFVGLANMMADSAGTIRAKTTAQKMQQIADAAQAYLKANQSAIDAYLAANSTDTITIPVAKQTEVAGQPVGTTGFPSIQAAGFLPPGFVDRTSNGQSHALLIKAAPNGKTDAVLTAFKGTSMSDKDLLALTSYIGAAGGAVFDEMTVTPDTHIVGTAAGWTYATNQWVGQLDGVAIQPQSGRPAISLAMKYSMEQPAPREGSATVTASGNFIDITGIPSWASRVTVMYDQLSHANTESLPIIQLGSAGGLETTGYISFSVLLSSSGDGTSSTNGFLQSAEYYNFWELIGSMSFERVSNNTWVATGSTGLNGGGWQHYLSTGRKTLSGSLTRIRLTTLSGTNPYDLGSVKVFWE